MSTEVVLEVRDVTKRFPTHTAVDRVSFDLPRGAFFALLGPSGCGKTTTLRMIAGFERPDTGSVILNGSRIDHLPPYSRDVSTVFQNYALFPHLTVRGNIEFGLKRKGERDLAGKVGAALELVRLSGKEDRMPSELSGGERQRVALARSLALAPQVLLLDEPLSALDPLLRKQVRAELKAIQRDSGITFLFVTHDQEEALSMSDLIAVMNQGRLEQIGSPQEIYLRPRTRFVADFLGAMNWIEGRGVRPESTRVSRDVPNTGAPSLAATVEDALFLGNCVHVRAQLANGERLVCEVPRGAGEFRRGDCVHVWWLPSDEVSFQ